MRKDLSFLFVKLKDTPVFLSSSVVTSEVSMPSLLKVSLIYSPYKSLPTLPLNTVFNPNLPIPRAKSAAPPPIQVFIVSTSHSSPGGGILSASFIISSIFTSP